MHQRFSILLKILFLLERFASSGKHSFSFFFFLNISPRKAQYYFSCRSWNICGSALIIVNENVELKLLCVMKYLRSSVTAFKSSSLTSQFWGTLRMVPELPEMVLVAA